MKPHRSTEEHFIAPNGSVENVGGCCAAVLDDESVHEKDGHLALLVKVKDTHILLAPSYGGTRRGEGLLLAVQLAWDSPPVTIDSTFVQTFMIR